MGNPFKKPKIHIPKPPKPPAPLPPPVIEEVAETPETKAELTGDRERRQRAGGSASNVKSSLSESVADQEFTSRISKLLG